MRQDATPSRGRVIGLMALFVVLGAPMVAYLWETLHQLLSLRVDGTRLLISVPVLALFLALLRLLARTLAGGVSRPSNGGKR